MDWVFITVRMAACGRRGGRFGMGERLRLCCGAARSHEEGGEGRGGIYCV